MGLLTQVIVQIELFAILAISLNLQLGYSGLFSVAQGAFYGIGAYTAGITAIELGVNPFVALLLAIVATAIFGLIMGLTAVRVSGTFLVVATIGAQVIATGFFSNLSITGGSDGLTAIPYLSIGSLVIVPGWGFVVLGAAFVLIVALISWRIVRSPVGLVLRAMRDDEEATNVLGKNTGRAKLLIFVISAGFTGIAGSLLGAFNSFISPDFFDLSTSVLVFTIVVLGGTGTILGGIVGAIIVVGLPEMLTFLPTTPGGGTYLQQVIYAALVLIFLVLRPQGIAGRYESVTSRARTRKPQDTAPEPERPAKMTPREAVK